LKLPPRTAAVVFLPGDDTPDLVQRLLELAQQLVFGGRDDLSIGQWASSARSYSKDDRTELSAA
jgi:hypothetical protein